MMYMQQNGGDRQMYEGNWSCSECGAKINRLPFQPDPSREGGLLCKDCHRNKREQSRKERPMFEGSWTCSRCGGEITKLPFEPDPSRLDTLVCRDCFKK